MKKRKMIHLSGGIRECLPERDPSGHKGTFGKAFIYSTPEYAIIKLPYEIAQGVIGAVFGMLLVYRCGLKKLFNNIVGNSGS